MLYYFSTNVILLLVGIILLSAEGYMTRLASANDFPLKALKVKTTYTLAYTTHKL